MGLDKWLKPEDIEKNSKKKKEPTKQTKKSKGKGVKDKRHEKQAIKLKKY